MWSTCAKVKLLRSTIVLLKQLISFSNTSALKVSLFHECRAVCLWRLWKSSQMWNYWYSIYFSIKCTQYWKWSQYSHEECFSDQFYQVMRLALDGPRGKKRDIVSLTSVSGCVYLSVYCVYLLYNSQMAETKWPLFLFKSCNITNVIYNMFCTIT